MTFEPKTFTENEISFLFENIKINSMNENLQKENNWNQTLQNYLQFRPFFKTELEQEPTRISSEFYKFDEEEKILIKGLPKDIIETIISNLQIESEDELIDFINKLYTIDKEFCNLYSHFYFNNVSTINMIEFMTLFKIK